MKGTDAERSVWDKASTTLQAINFIHMYGRVVMFVVPLSHQSICYYLLYYAVRGDLLQIEERA